MIDVINTIYSGLWDSEGKNTRVTVICRTGALVNDLKSHISQHGGAMGLNITTIRSLASELVPDSLVDSIEQEEVSPDNELLDRIGENRPGLMSHLKSLVSKIRLNILAGTKIDATLVSMRMQQVLSLVKSDWGQSKTESEVRWLMERVKSGDIKELNLGKIYSLGFDMDLLDSDDEIEFSEKWAGLEFVPTRTTPWEIYILERLNVTSLTKQNIGKSDEIPAVKVNDVVAGVKLAVKILLQTTENINNSLILVPDEVTAERFSAVAFRNKIKVTRSRSNQFLSHPLSSLMRIAAPWFSQEDVAVIKASELEEILSHRIIRNSFNPQIRELIKYQVESLNEDSKKYMGSDENMFKFNKKRLNKMLIKIRIVEGRVDDWISRIKALIESEEIHYKRDYIYLFWRFLLLKAALEGVGEPKIMEKYGFSYPDGDNLKHSKQSNDLDLPQPGTFGAMRRFFTDSGLNIQGDNCGKAILNLLKRDKDELISPRKLNRLLRGNANSGILESGISLLLYEDYDNRKVENLIFLGVNNKGISKIGSADPFLSEMELIKVGVISARADMIFRLLQMMRAAKNGSNCVAIVSSKDSGGRAVVPPVQLALDFDNKGTLILQNLGTSHDEIISDSFGVEIDIPEKHEKNGLIRTNKTYASIEELINEEYPSIEEMINPRMHHLMLQANAELYRTGRGIRKFNKQLLKLLKFDVYKVVEPETSLADKIFCIGDPAPDWVMPYLGYTGALIGDEWNRDQNNEIREWSVSSHFELLTNSLYRFFVERILGISEPEIVPDEPDFKEIGTIVHSAFEKLDAGDAFVKWRLAKTDDVNEVRRTTYESLIGHLDNSFEIAKQELGIVNESVLKSMDNMKARWKNRMGRNLDNLDPSGYVVERIKSYDEQVAMIDSQIKDDIEDTDPFKAIVKILADNLVEQGKTEKESNKKTKTWVHKAYSEINKMGFAKFKAKFREIPQNRAMKKEIVLGSTMAQKDFALLFEMIHDDEFEKLIPKIQEEERLMRNSMIISTGETVSTVSEFPFGKTINRNGNPGAYPVTVRFGDYDVALKGKIDRIMVVENETIESVPERKSLIHLLDYKTGRRADTHEKLMRKIWNLSKPQLSIYAVAVSELMKNGVTIPGIPGGSEISELAYDFVKDESGLQDRFFINPEFIEMAKKGIGELIGMIFDGKFSLITKNNNPWGYYKGYISLESASRADDTALWAVPHDDDKSSSKNKEEIIDLTCRGEND